MLDAMKAAIALGVIGSSGSSGGLYYALIAQDPATGAKLLARPLLGSVYGGVVATLRIHLHPSGESETINTSEGVTKTLYFEEHANWKDSYTFLPWARTDNKRRAGEIAIGIPTAGPKDCWAAGEHFVNKGAARELWKALTSAVPKGHLRITQEQFTTFVNAAMLEMSASEFELPPIPTTATINAGIETANSQIEKLTAQIAALKEKISADSEMLKKGLPTLADMLPEMPKGLTAVKPDYEVRDELQGYAKESNAKPASQVDDDEDTDEGDAD